VNPADSGAQGRSFSSDAGWTNFNTSACGGEERIHCFEHSAQRGSRNEQRCSGTPNDSPAAGRKTLERLGGC